MIESNQCLEQFRAKTWDELNNTVQDETKYLMSSELNKERLLESINTLFVKDPSRMLKLYTGRGGMEMFQKVLKENLEKSDEIFGDLDY